jgi:mannose-6-phosphate isomerase-like protein (cupin superfamily)
VDAFDVPRLVAGLDHSRHDLREFFRSDTLSMTIAYWPAGSVDNQAPHTEEETYFVAIGRAAIEVAGESRPVVPGSIIHIPPGVDHRFHSIEEDLTVVIFWAPPRLSETPNE